MSGTYNLWLVGVSLLVGTVTSYFALQLAPHVTAARHRLAARVWLVAAALTMGIGIWSTHFIGMLAFRHPMPMSYGITCTALSLAIAVVFSGLALGCISGVRLPRTRLLTGAALMGSGTSGWVP